MHTINQGRYDYPNAIYIICTSSNAKMESQDEKKENLDKSAEAVVKIFRIAQNKKYRLLNIY